MFKENEDVEDVKCAEAKDDIEKTQYLSKLVATKLNDKTAKVLISTDLHLWKKDGKDRHIVKRHDFESVVKYYQETLKPNDLWIFLGDFVDGEFTDYNELRRVLLTIPGKKIMVRGNNDLFSYEYYRSCGMLYICRSFVWHNILFTHFPVENSYDLNIHGHIHGFKRYWIPYTNQIDVFRKDRKLQLLMDVISQQPEYAKQINEVKDKVQQESCFEQSVEYHEYFIDQKDPFDA